MSTVISAENNPIYMIVLCAIFLLFITATLVNIFTKSNTKFKTSKKRIQVLLSIFCLIFSGYVYSLSVSYDNKVVSQTLNLIEKNENISDLRIVNNPHDIVCNTSFKGSVSAISWKEDNKQKLGLMIGKKTDKGCSFSVKPV